MAVLGLSAASVYGLIPADLVAQPLPCFKDKGAFDVYSGMLRVEGPFEGTAYSSLSIHYQFHTSLHNPSSDPVVAWHQGGPGGSSIFGLYGEMGYFRIDSDGCHINADVSWNQVANMLYLESPAGASIPSSGRRTGFSACYEKNGSLANICEWDDRTQAAAYSKTLEAFLAAFPEFAANDLYLTGESYAGQYLPNIAAYITANMWPQQRLSKLRGIAIGNGCWGGSETSASVADCRGVDGNKNLARFFYGKGLVSEKAYEATLSSCKTYGDRSQQCISGIRSLTHDVGPHNVYNVYDNCPELDAWHAYSGRSRAWLREYLLDNTPLAQHHVDELAHLGGGRGGYDWSCGEMTALAAWIRRDDVTRALHLPRAGGSGFSYERSGPASILLLPSLLSQIRVLIYSGDADSCVPYTGSEEWTSRLASPGRDQVVVEDEPWRPWFDTSTSGRPPAGYVTTYSVKNSSSVVGPGSGKFHFLTIRMAGHMVPQYAPRASFAFIKKWLAGERF